MKIKLILAFALVGWLLLAALVVRECTVKYKSIRTEVLERAIKKELEIYLVKEQREGRKVIGSDKKWSIGENSCVATIDLFYACGPRFRSITIRADYKDGEMTSGLYDEGSWYRPICP